MTDYSFDPSPAEVADAQSFIATTLDDTAVWRSVSYAPDGHGGSTRVFTDTTIPVWARNPGAKPASFSKSPGETNYEWEFICRVSDLIQPKDVIRYNGNDVEVFEISQRGTSSFAQLIYGRRVGA